MSEIAVMQKNDVIQQVDMQTITEYLDSTGLTKQLMPNEKTMFINMAKDYGLNPFKREIYCTVYGEGQWRQCSIVTGYEVYLKRAERIGKLDGWNVTVSGSIKDESLAATVTIYRKDWTHPFTHTAYYVECVQKSKKTGQPNAIWGKMPIFMTKKVAIAQAFRLCFSDEFGGMPYTNDELGVEQIAERPVETLRTVEAEVVEQATEQSDVRSQLEKLLNKYGELLKKSSQSPTPYETAFAAVNNATDEEVDSVYTRCVVWLGKQGINVEV